MWHSGLMPTTKVAAWLGNLNRAQSHRLYGVPNGCEAGVSLASPAQYGRDGSQLGVRFLILPPISPDASTFGWPTECTLA